MEEENVDATPIEEQPEGQQPVDESRPVAEVEDGAEHVDEQLESQNVVNDDADADPDAGPALI